MSVTTWNIDVDYLEPRYPNEIKQESGGGLPSASPLNDAALTAIVLDACSQVNGMLTNAGLSPSTIAAGTTTNAYAAVRQLIAEVCKPGILRAAYGLHNASKTLEEERFAVQRMLERYQGNPGLLGLGLDTDAYSPQAATSTGYFELEVDEESQRRRRRFDRGGIYPETGRKKKWW